MKKLTLFKCYGEGNIPSASSNHLAAPPPPPLKDNRLKIAKSIILLETLFWHLQAFHGEEKLVLLIYIAFTAVN